MSKSEASSMPRVYLAGPEVFLPTAIEVGARKMALCDTFGIVGLFPLDNALEVAGLVPAAQAREIAMANEDLMRSADALIANLTPFRGPSMDCGTAYEVGFMRALGRPVYGYTTTALDYHTRAMAFRAATAPWAQAGVWVDGDQAGNHIENFGLTENLMIDIALRDSGLAPVVEGRVAADIGDLAAFQACLAAVAPLILTRWRQSRT